MYVHLDNQVMVPFVLVYTRYLGDLNTNVRIDNHLAGGVDLDIYFFVCFVLKMSCLLFLDRF